MRSLHRCLWGTLLLAAALCILASCQHTQPSVGETPSANRTKQIAMVVAIQGYDTAEFWGLPGLERF